MISYTIDYDAPNKEYYIETSLIRDEIAFYLETSDGNRYWTLVCTLSRIAGFLESNFPDWKNFIRASPCSSKILVDTLSKKMIAKAVEKAFSTGFYNHRRSRSPSAKTAEGDLGAPILESISSEMLLLGTTIPERIMSVHVNEKFYTLHLVEYPAVQEYFDLLKSSSPEDAILAVPGLVLIRSWEDVTPEDIITLCKQQGVFTE